ncbi:MAG: HAD family hydrolase [Mesorhizobium sp.]|nr:HAD family hydrolase [Mesorhizobium sp. M1E.F.Ca.ET.045.02.1.1]TIU00378.1 MAG: HAD family hydrolase [Mesorhizobium sp.]TJW81340.1 MAG: HAD family hydrolase [Mesorhizobium sp.]
MMPIRAIVFDVDGTLAETEDLHRRAFNQSFAEHGLSWNWDSALYAELLAIAGGRERIIAYSHRMKCQVDAAALHARKTDLYNKAIREGAIALRPGVEGLIDHARRKGLLLAIGTTTSRVNVMSLLQSTLGDDGPRLFATIRTGEDVKAKKPDPEVYRLVLSDLGLEGSQCICIEDSRNGLLAASGSGMRTVITPSQFSCHEDFSGADLILRNLAMPWSSAEFRPYTSLMAQPVELGRLLTRERA